MSPFVLVAKECAVSQRSAGEMLSCEIFSTAGFS